MDLPVDEVREALFRCVVPAGAVAGVVFTSVAYLSPKRLATLAAVLALVAAFAQANYLASDPVSFRLEADRPLTMRDLSASAANAIVRPSTDTDATAESTVITLAPRYWLPWLALLALLVDLLARLPHASVAGWILRPAVALLAGRMLLPADWSAEWPWPEALLAALILMLWLVPRMLIHHQPGGWVPLALAIAFQGAAIVLLQAASLSLTYLALVGFAGLLGVAVSAWQNKEDASGVTGAAAVILPALLLFAKTETFSSVWLVSFVLAAVAPLAMTPLLLMPRTDQPPTRRFALVGIALAVLPVVVAVVLAVLAEMVSATE